jgi:hypothetical protein
MQRRGDRRYTNTIPTLWGVNTDVAEKAALGTRCKGLSEALTL